MRAFIEITDFGAPELDVYARLTEAQLLNRFEPKKGMFIAESPKVIARALDADCEPVSFLVEQNHVNQEAEEVIRRCGDVPVYTASLEVLTQLTGFRLTRGMLCAIRRPSLLPMERVLQGARRIAILEEVMNPTNVGAIFRSAAALGIDGILLTPGCTDPLYRRCARVSMGTVFQIPWTFIPEGQWPGVMEDLHTSGFKTVAAALTDKSVTIEDPVLCGEERLAILLGSEGDGLKENTIAACDYTVRIPMAHGVDSLNVAAASAVIFWQLRSR